MTWAVMLEHVPSSRAIARWVESVADVGLHVGSPVWVFTATGEDVLRFERVESAVDYICTSGGLISLFGTVDGDELSLSVHHRRGILNAELQGVGDIPKFDEVRIDIAPCARALRAAAWTTFESRVLDIAGDAGVFAFCVREWWWEAMMPIQIHGSVSKGRIPDMRPPTSNDSVGLLAVAAPTGSRLAAKLGKRATAMGLPSRSQRAGWDEYRPEGSI